MSTLSIDIILSTYNFFMLLYECLQILTRQLWMRRQVRVGASLLGCMAVELCYTVTYLHRAAEL